VSHSLNLHLELVNENRGSVLVVKNHLIHPLGAADARVKISRQESTEIRFGVLVPKTRFDMTTGGEKNETSSKVTIHAK